jgi:hypothetical protein
MTHRTAPRLRHPAPPRATHCAIYCATPFFAAPTPAPILRHSLRHPAPFTAPETPPPFRGWVVSRQNLVAQGDAR